MYQTSEALAAALDGRHTIRVTACGSILGTENFLTADAEVVLVGYSTSSEEFLVRTGSGDIISCTYTASCCGGETIAIGCVAAASVQIVVSGIIDLLNQVIIVEVGSEELNEWVPLGTFVVTECKNDEDITTITAYDAAYYATAIDYTPTVDSEITVEAVIEDIAQQCDLTVGILPSAASTTIITGDLIGHTCREMLGYMAALMGRNAVIDRDGTLQLIWFTSSGAAIDPDTYYSGGFSYNGAHYLAAISVTQTVKEPVVNDDGTTQEQERTVTLNAGEGSGTGIGLENPYFTQEILDAVWSDIGGLDYSVGTCSFFGGLLTEPGDLISITDKQGNTFVFPVMTVSLTLDGGCKAEISAAGQSTPDASAVFTGGLNGQISRIEADVGVFKKLTAESLEAQTAKLNNLSVDDIKAGIIHSADYATAIVPLIYPADDLYPSKERYPSNGEEVTSGFAIDFASGIIYGVFYSAQIAALEKRVSELENLLEQLTSTSATGEMMTMEEEQ